MQIEFIYNGDDSENEYSCSTHDMPVVPRVGERFIHYAPGDETDSIGDKKNVKMIDGIVERVEYEFDQNEYKNIGRRDSFYVIVYVKGDYRTPTLKGSQE
jgi:hypothetical protein